MKWVYMKWGDGYKPSLCHPYYARVRAEHLATKYNAKIEHKEELADLWFDLGGMVNRDDPSITVRLGKDRTFSCYRHHAADVIGKLERAMNRRYSVGHRTYCQTARWPGVLCYLSQADVKKAIKELMNIDPSEAITHMVEMRESLVNANVRNQGPKVEKEIRKILRAPPRVQA